LVTAIYIFILRGFVLFFLYLLDDPPTLDFGAGRPLRSDRISGIAVCSNASLNPVNVM
jgi:hypothetical protein